MTDRTNSPAAVAALGRAAAHLAKALSEVHQARQILRDVRYLPDYPYMQGVGALIAILREEHSRLNDVAKVPAGFVLRSETPEEDS